MTARGTSDAGRGRALAWAGALLASTLSLPGVAGAQTGEELLAAHAEALGGVAALESVGTLRRSGTSRVETAFFDRIESRAELAVVVGEKVYHRSDAGSFSTTSVWDGSRGWEVGPEGFRELAGDELRLLKQSARPFRLAGVGLEEGTRVSREQDREVGGLDYHVVSIEAADGHRVTVLLHPETRLAIRAVQTTEVPGLGPSELVVSFFDYAEHDGISLPGRVRTSIAGVFSAETVFTATELDPELDPGLFTPPR
jgi:hypothetical protein